MNDVKKLYYDMRKLGRAQTKYGGFKVSLDSDNKIKAKFESDSQEDELIIINIGGIDVRCIDSIDSISTPTRNEWNKLKKIIEIKHTQRRGMVFQETIEATTKLYITSEKDMWVCLAAGKDNSAIMWGIDGEIPADWMLFGFIMKDKKLSRRELSILFFTAWLYLDTTEENCYYDNKGKIKYDSKKKISFEDRKCILDDTYGYELDAHPNKMFFNKEECDNIVKFGKQNSIGKLAKCSIDDLIKSKKT